MRQKRRLKRAAGWVLLAILGIWALSDFLHGGNVSSTKITKHADTSKIIPSEAPTSHATPPTPAPTGTQLTGIVQAWANTYGFTSAVYVHQLTGTGMQTVGYNQDASIVPASTYKIYVAYAILHGVEQGSYSLNGAAGDGNTIQTDLTNMIVNSDNDAARTLGFLYGWKNINSLLVSQGITHTDLFNYVPPSTDPVGDKHTTAGDLAMTLEKLQGGKLLNAADTSLLLGLMEQQNYRERIPAGVPSGVTVADKPGWLTGTDDGTTHIENDAAIVYGPKSTYVLVIMTSGNQDTTPLAKLSQSIYNYLEG